MFGNHTDQLGGEVTPAEYAGAVLNFSKLPTGAGRNHERLATFLQRSQPANPVSRPDEKDFLTLYKLGSTQQDSRQEIEQATDDNSGQDPHSQHKQGPSWLERPTRFQSLGEFAIFRPPSSKDAHSQLLFLQGYPLPEWLNLIGSKYHVDPEFFARHLDFRSTADPSNTFSVPSPPSSSWHLISLQITTLGAQETAGRVYKQEEINRTRTDAKVALKEYHRQMAVGANVNTGDAIVRHFSIFDEVHFAIEQRISICVREIGHSWVCKGSLFSFVFVFSPSPLIRVVGTDISGH